MELMSLYEAWERFQFGLSYIAILATPVEWGIIQNVNYTSTLGMFLLFCDTLFLCDVFIWWKRRQLSPSSEINDGKVSATAYEISVRCVSSSCIIIIPMALLLGLEGRTVAWLCLLRMVSLPLVMISPSLSRCRLFQHFLTHFPSFFVSNNNIGASWYPSQLLPLLQDDWHAVPEV